MISKKCKKMANKNLPWLHKKSIKNQKIKKNTQHRVSLWLFVYIYVFSIPPFIAFFIAQYAAYILFSMTNDRWLSHPSFMARKYIMML